MLLQMKFSTSFNQVIYELIICPQGAKAYHDDDGLITTESMQFIITGNGKKVCVFSVGLYCAVG